MTNQPPKTREELLEETMAEFDGMMDTYLDRHAPEISKVDKLRLKGNLDVYVRSRIQLHERAAVEAVVPQRLYDHLEHSWDCILSRFSAGRSTEDGGYEQKYGGKWYQVSPIDKTPKCNCGLSDLLTRAKEYLGDKPTTPTGDGQK